MTERRKSAGLPFETPPHQIRQLFQSSRQKLKSHLPPELQILRPVHDSHAAAAQFLDHPEVRDRLTGQILRVQCLGSGNHFRHSGVFHIGDKAVSTPRHCLYVTGLLRRIPQGNTELTNRGIDAQIELDDGVVGPEALLNLLAHDG